MKNRRGPTCGPQRRQARSKYSQTGKFVTDKVMGGDEFQVTRRPGPGRCCPGFIGSIRCSLRSGRNQADDQERQIILTRLAASERPHLGEHSTADFSGGSVIWDSQRAPQTIFAEFLSLRIVGFRKAIGKQRQDVAFLNPDPAFLIGGAGQ
jgi:hypothetical protein